MKGTTIAVITLGIVNIGLMGLDHVANKHGRKAAELEAIQKRGEEANAAIDAIKKRCELHDDLLNRERNMAKIQMEDWIKAHDFNERRKDILNGVSNGLQEFKNQIGYSETMQEITDKFDAGVEAVKATLGYSVNKAKYEKAIEDAKSHYDSQKALFDVAGDDISEEAMKLRHAAEEAMNAKIKEAKAQLDILEGKLNTEVERLTQDKMSAVRELEEKVSKQKIVLDHKSERELKALNDELSKAETDIKNAVKNKRTEQEIESVKRHEDDIRLIRELKDADAKVADDIFNSKNEAVKIGEYLKAKKIPKFVVPVFGAVSLIPVGYLSYVWCRFLGQVMRAM